MACCCSLFSRIITLLTLQTPSAAREKKKEKESTASEKKKVKEFTRKKNKKEKQRSERGRKIWGFTSGHRSSHSGTTSEHKSEITKMCSQMPIQLHDVYDPNKINVNGPPCGAVAAESKRTQANWVVFDKQLKQEEKRRMEDKKRSQPKSLRLKLGPIVEPPRELKKSGLRELKQFGTSGTTLEQKSEITDTCSQMSPLQLHDVYDPNKINVNVKINSGSPVAAEFKKAQANCVVFDRQFKYEKKRCVEDKKRSQPKPLRLKLVQIVEPPREVKQSGTSSDPETSKRAQASCVVFDKQIKHEEKRELHVDKQVVPDGEVPSVAGETAQLNSVPKQKGRRDGSLMERDNRVFPQSQRHQKNDLSSGLSYPVISNDL